MHIIDVAVLSAKAHMKIASRITASDTGASRVLLEGKNDFVPNHMIPEYGALNGKTTYIIYQPAANIRVTDVKVELYSMVVFEM